MEICSFQVIYLLCLMGGGAGRDVDGEGESREIGNSGVISGGGDGRGLHGLSELVPHHIRVRDGLEISQRSSASGADCCYFGCSWEASSILSRSWGAAIHFPALPVPREPPWPCWGLGRQDTARTRFRSASTRLCSV